MPSTRQLAAIMFTDIVGYTTLMGEDEQKAFEILNKNRQLQRSLIEQHNGKWIKELGDGVLASFSTVTDAVLCATKIQKACNKDCDYKLRIGIHQGEVVFENDDVFGDGVNIASRIQAIAPIGGIWISESIYNNIANKKQIVTKYVREEILKHVKEPIRIYEVLIESSQQKALITNPVMKTIPDKSIAVLPFVNMSNDPEQEYFSDGMAEEILNSLAQLEDLNVAGRTSSFQFKGKNIDVREVGEKLRVRTVLEGSVRKQGNRLRITTQLINVEDGYHLWSERYDREMDDIFAIQDEIASKIAEHMKVTFFGSYETRDERKPTSNLEAYELFLKGDYYHKKYSSEGFKKAIEYFKKAVELDPYYVDAWWSLGLTQFEQKAINPTFPIAAKKVMETALNCAERALEIDNANADGHFLLALIHFNYDYDWSKVESEIRIGNKYLQTRYPLMFLPLEPWYRATLYSDFDFAINKLQKGVEDDRLSIFYLLHLALLYLHGLRDYVKARYILNRIIELDPLYNEAWIPMCLSYLFEGNNKDAEQYARKAYDSGEGGGYGVAYLIICLAFSGKKEEAVELFESAKEKLPPSEFVPSLHAKVNAYLGRLDEAFEFLSKCVGDKEIWICSMLKFSPEWDLLRSDPNFKVILKQMNFPE